MNTKGWLEKRDNIRAEISTKVRIKLIDDDVAHALMLHKESASQSTDRTVLKKDLAMERSRNGNSVTMSDFPSSLDDTTHPALTYLVDSVSSGDEDRGRTVFQAARLPTGGKAMPKSSKRGGKPPELVFLTQHDGRCQIAAPRAPASNALESEILGSDR